MSILQVTAKLQDYSSVVTINYTPYSWSTHYISDVASSWSSDLIGYTSDPISGWARPTPQFCAHGEFYTADGYAACCDGSCTRWPTSCSSNTLLGQGAVVTDCGKDLVCGDLNVYESIGADPTVIFGCLESSEFGGMLVRTPPLTTYTPTSTTPSSSSTAKSPKSNSSSPSITSPTTSSTASPTLVPPDNSQTGRAIIAGASVGGIAGLSILLALVWFFLRRRKRKHEAAQWELEGLNQEQQDPVYETEANEKKASELHGDMLFLEATKNNRISVMNATEEVCELDGAGVVVELPLRSMTMPIDEDDVGVDANEASSRDSDGHGEQHAEAGAITVRLTEERRDT